MTQRVFEDRRDAGRRLAHLLEERGPWPGVVVLGLPRGGVPVAAPIAEALEAPLDVLVVRKLGLPHHEEVAMGAIGEQGVRVVNEQVLRFELVDDRSLAAVERRERAELEARIRRFRGDAPPVDLAGRTALLVDDGVATGATAKAASLVARALGAASVVLAVPVASPDAAIDLVAWPAVDELVCLATPAGFMAVGQSYLDFTQTTDAEVQALLAAHR
ncbi:putative phosphoribosyl transferase [Agromyces sp. CF514]|uniref:phosphoribosyltransferase n=1 Tax=Agromyces sp. CF514 TaxID=1881031 RepID=UPI0008DF4BE1|nr:phosphoribosyltransferase family protein [Agromyces sp. CF514]SFR74213.1 putative phosphoribosyl transferase [Agromyces sp. CF514]